MKRWPRLVSYTETEYEKVNIEKVVMEFLRITLDSTDLWKVTFRTWLLGTRFDDRNPRYDEKEGPDEIYIDSVQEVSEWTFDGTSDYLREGVILVNFQARVEISADDPMGGPSHDEDGDLDSSRMVTVSGAVLISVDPVDLMENPMKSSGQQLLERADVSIDDLDDISLVPRSY